MTATMPIAAATPIDRLPRADALTDALLGRDTNDLPAEPVTPAGVRAVRARVAAGLSELSSSASSAPALLRVGHYQVASAPAGTARAASRGGAAGAGAGAGARAGEATFRWTTRTARRTVGLAALRAGLDGRAATPADAVALVLSDPGGPAGVGRAGPGSCADWISILPHPARALVAAEAASWTTRLWTALDWGRLDAHRLAVGGPDRWWRWTGTSGGDHSSPQRGGALRIAVRGRADIRLGPGRDETGSARSAHLLVLDGQPGARTRHALLLSPLVDALSSPHTAGAQQVPSRVVGWWPDSGKAWVVRVDDRTLAVAADALVETVASLLGAAVQGG